MSAEPAPPAYESLTAVDGAVLRVAAACEELRSLRSGEAAGWRFHPAAAGEHGPVALSALDWRDAEKLDFLVLDGAAEALASRGPGMAVLPVSFSTLSSSRGRRELTERLSGVAQAAGRRLAIEVRDLKGVPPQRLAEVLGLVRPACSGVIAETGPDRAEIAAIGHCGLSGVAIRTASDWSADPAHLSRFQALTELARGCAPVCLARAVEDDLVVLAAAGFTHGAVARR